MSRREQLEAMLTADPDDVFVRYALAMALASEGDTQAALQSLDEVLARDPRYVAAYFQKGQILADEAEVDQARDVLNRGIQVAREVGDEHAAGEMTEFLESL